MRLEKRLFRALIVVLWVNIGLVSAFFGFSGSSTDVPKTTRVGCLAWRQTANCDGNGPREPSADINCGQNVASDRSGYCECSFGIVGRSGCRHRRFSCEDLCYRGFQQMNSDGTLDWLGDTVWHWNNWREVKFQSDGIFWAPTRECESNQCIWKVKKSQIYIFWGSDGLHTVSPSSDKKTLTGNRYDGQSLSAKFVRKEGFDEAGNQEEDLYEVLGIDVDATEGEIRKAYRKLSRELHPDKVADPAQKEELEAKFIKVQSAYSILKEEDTRMVYDTGGMEAIDRIKDPNQQQRGMDPFSMFFGGGGGGGNSNKGNDVKLQMDVALELLFTGGETVHNFNRRVVCRRCSSVTDKNRERCSKCRTKCPGEVKMVQRRMGHMLVQQQEEVPSKERCTMEDAELHLLIEKGMKSGDELKFERKNEQTPGQIPGDVIVVVKQKRHRMFSRVNENDLKITFTVSLKEALTGVDRKIKHLDGHEVVIKTSPGEIVYPKKVMRIADEGMPFHNFPSQKGVLLVEFEVDFPKSLSPEQAAAISNLF